MMTFLGLYIEDMFRLYHSFMNKNVEFVKNSFEFLKAGWIFNIFSIKCKVQATITVSANLSEPPIHSTLKLNWCSPTVTAIASKVKVAPLINIFYFMYIFNILCYI